MMSLAEVNYCMMLEVDGSAEQSCLRNTW